MLFTSGLRKAVGTQGKGDSSRLLELKRAQLRRRHTCATILSANQQHPVVEKKLIPVLETFVEQEDSGGRLEAHVDKSADLRRQRSNLELRERSEEREQSSSSNLLKSSLPPTTAPPPLPPVMSMPPKPMFGGAPPVNDPPLPLPTRVTSLTSNGSKNFDPWDSPNIPVPPPYLATPANAPISAQSLPPPPAFGASMGSTSQNHNVQDDDFDDDWSDDDEELPESTSTAAQRMAVSRSRSAGPDTMSATGKPGTVRMKTMNRFSNFVKTGMESYILAQTKMTTPSTEKHQVILAGNLVEWAAPRDFYQCIIDKPKKESKLKGLKSFIAYSMTCSLTGIQVSRRYKHFDWLHEQLSNKYLLVALPPLPEKQVSGRYEEDLIEHRKCILQLWANKICRHPVLSHSEVWKHFMTCTDEKKWKIGKRQAEKDEYVGGNFFNCVTTPPQPVDLAKAETQIETFSKSMRSLDESVKTMFERVNESQKRMIGPYKSNWQKMAAAFMSLGQSFEADQTTSSTGVKNAIKESANVLHKIGSQHEENGKKEMEQLLDWLYVYKGICANVPDILNVHKSAFSKLRDNERLQAEGKLSPAEADAIRQRVDVVTYAMLAEINHLNQERNDDFRQMLGSYFSQQAQFYTGIGQQLGQLAEQFKKS
uniref:PX domain-containing protein n=1 Tax=Acrobeloides nanus TaxID=290746 RepID=A0A914BYU7_9BILA